MPENHQDPECRKPLSNEKAETVQETNEEVLSLLSVLQGMADDHTRSDAFAALYEKYLPLSESLVTRYYAAASGNPLIDRYDLEEEACVALYRAAMMYRVGAATTFGAYAKVCIRNRLISYLRSHSSRGGQLTNEALLSAVDADADPGEQIVRRDEFRATVDRFLGSLTRYEREVFDLYISGRTYHEIAVQLGVTEKSVDNAVYRFRVKLKQLLQR